jgi:hypothetical protein
MSTTLTVALASLGGIVLAGVVAHGAWQARRAGPKRASPSEREEPSASAPRDSDASELVDDNSAADDAAAPPRRISKRLPLQLDALIDACAPITIDAPVAATSSSPTCRRSAMSAASSSSSKGSTARPARGKRRPRGAATASCRRACSSPAGPGALNEIEYSEFVQRMQAFAEAIGAGMDPPDMLDVMARARELDAFASQHDAQLAVHCTRAARPGASATSSSTPVATASFPGVVPAGSSIRRRRRARRPCSR